MRDDVEVDEDKESVIDQADAERELAETQPPADVEGSPLPARQSGLLPCGWCGSSAEDASVPNSPDNPQLVSCSNTKCPLAFGFALPIELWNTRFPDASKVKLPLPTEYLCIDPQGKLDELHLQLCLRCQEAAQVGSDASGYVRAAIIAELRNISRYTLWQDQSWCRNQEEREQVEDNEQMERERFADTVIALISQRQEGTK